VLALGTSAACAQLSPGSAAPVDLGRTRGGDPVSLSDRPGKVHAVSFWASWCAPCRVELPMLEQLQRELGPEKIQVIAVNVEDREQFRDATRRMLDWKIILSNDPQSQVQKTYKGRSIPHLTIIGRDGKVRKVFIGYAESELREVVTAIVSAVNE
jgi:thiol-disulfide isomerase/thioredoxin